MTVPVPERVVAALAGLGLAVVFLWLPTALVRGDEGRGYERLMWRTMAVAFVLGVVLVGALVR